MEQELIIDPQNSLQIGMINHIWILESGMCQALGFSNVLS